MTVRYFALRTSESGKEKSVFTGRQPRQAALKAASRNYTSIYLRERGTSKLHFYKGVRRKVRAPVDRPSWMAAVVWKPNVRKMRIIHLKKPKKAKKAKRRRKAKRRTTRRKVKRKAKKRKAPKRKAKRRTKRKAPKRKAKRRTTKRKTTKRRTTKRKTTKRKTKRRRR